MANIGDAYVTAQNMKDLIATGKLGSGELEDKLIKASITLVETTSAPAGGYYRGTTAKWKVTVVNTGVVAQGGISITPSIGTWSGTPSAGSYSNNKLVIPSMAPNDTVTAEISYTILPADVGKGNMTIQLVYQSDSNNLTFSSDPFPVNSQDVMVPSTEAEFQAMSWEMISVLGTVVRANPSGYSKMVGWTKDVVLGAPINKTVTHEIVDICHTDYGTNHAFIFMPKEQVLGTAQHTSAAAANKKYTDSLIDAGLQPGGTYWPALPADLVAVMKDCNIKYFTSAGTSGWSGTSPATITRKWFLPAVVEVGLVASANTNYNNEGTVFARFASASNNDRIRKNGTSAAYWWLRSLVIWNSGGTVFGVVNANGGLNDYYSNTSYGLCPCFAV